MSRQSIRISLPMFWTRVSSKNFYKIIKSFNCPLETGYQYIANGENVTGNSHGERRIGFSITTLTPDPNSFAADAMQQDLNKMFTFAFPPFSLIGRVINKVLWKNIKAMILVTPSWQTQPWYTLLLRMSIQRPLLLPALPYLLLHLQGEKHSDCELKIAAWKITQKPGNGRNFKQCSQTGLHIQKTRFYSRLRIGGNK